MLAQNCTISKQGRTVKFNIFQTTSTMNTSLGDLFALSIPDKYRPQYPKIAVCSMYNKGDNKHYLGYIRIAENGNIQVNAFTNQGGLIGISSGTTYFIWACSMSWDSYK